MDGTQELRSLPRRAVSVMPFTYFVLNSLVGLAAVIGFTMYLGARLPPRAHLPWPALTVLFATPGGALTFMLLVAALVYIPLRLAHGRLLPGHWLVGSADVTDSSILAWACHPPAGPRRTWAARWLGSIALAALTLALWIATFQVWSGTPWHLFERAASCPANSCPPAAYLGPIVAAGGVFAGQYCWLAAYRWLRRIEAQCGIRFRRRSWWGGAPLYYVRQTGVTAEEAAQRLARVAPRVGRPALRFHAWNALSLVPYALVGLALIQLELWLLPYWAG